MKLRSTLIAAVAVLAAAAVMKTLPVQDMLHKEIPGIENPSESAAGTTPVSYVSDGSFAYKLYQVMPTDKNYMFSPFSIKAALTLAANGADGETLKELEDVMQSGDINTLNADIQALTQRYESLEGTELKIADSIWLNTDVARGITFNKNYAAKV